MGTTLWGLPMYLFGFFCLFLTLSYAVQWPKAEKGRERPSWLHVIIRWGHPLVWLLLAAACFLWYWRFVSLGTQVAINAMLLYFVFIAAFVYDKQLAKRYDLE